MPTVTTSQHAILMRAQNELKEVKARHKQRKLELLQQRSSTAPAGIPPSLAHKTASSQGFQMPTTTSSGAQAAIGAAAVGLEGAGAGAAATRKRLEKQDSIMWTAALSKATEVLIDKPDTIAMVGAAMTRHKRKQKDAADAAAAAAAAAAAKGGGSSLSASQPSTIIPSTTLQKPPSALPGPSRAPVFPTHAEGPALSLSELLASRPIAPQPVVQPYAAAAAAAHPSLSALSHGNTNGGVSPSTSAMSTDVPPPQRAAAASGGGAEAGASTRRAERRRVLKGKANQKGGGGGGSGMISPAVSTDTLLGGVGSGVGAGAVEEALHIEIDDLKAKLKAETAERTKQVCVCVCCVVCRVFLAAI